MCGKKDVFNGRGRYCGSSKNKTGCSYKKSLENSKKSGLRFRKRQKKYKKYYEKHLSPTKQNN